MLGGAALAGVLIAQSIVVSTPAGAADDESVLGQGGGSLILVLDGSGSMKEPAGDGRTRMEAAKEGLEGVIEKLPEDSRAGLRVYGSTISDGAGSCEDSELLAPVEEIDKAALQAGVDELKPLGNTPIAYSLEKAYEDLPSEGPRSIVLVSDGEENCGGDPCKVAADLKKKGADFYVDVVGLQVDVASRNQLTCIASKGGGTYYDVQDIDQLDSALTRTSVRAARAYEPAGLPVEGGTSLGDAVDVEDGQWLDTIGDSGEEFYTLPDPGEGTIHASAAFPPALGTRDAAREDLTVAVLDASGAECGRPGRVSQTGLGNEKAPVVSAVSVTAEDREACGEGPFVLRVGSSSVGEQERSLEVLVRTEPAVETTSGLPEAFDQGSGYTDEVQGTEPSGGVVPVVGGPNFSSAPPTAAGKAYSDTILPGETLFYRVPDVGWGQQVVCDIDFQPSAQAEAAFGRTRGAVRSTVSSPLKVRLYDFQASQERTAYTGSETVSTHVATVPVRYLNREVNVGEVIPQTALDGDYYCAAAFETPVGADDLGEYGEIDLELTVSVVGEEAGAPEYVSPPPETANEQQADDASDSSPPWLWIAVAVVALVLLALALLRALRRRAASGDDADDDPTT